MSPSVRLHLTRRGWALLVGAAAFVVVAYGGGRPEVLSVGILAAALVVLAAAAAWIARPRLDVERHLHPALPVVGSPVEDHLVLRNGGRLATGPASVGEGVSWSADGAPPVPVPALPPGGATRVALELRPPGRGVHTVGPLTVESLDPFGVVRLRVRVGAESPLPVAPDLVRLPTASGALRADGEAAAQARAAHSGGADLLTRPYRTGDPMRRVHWRVTARAGELMVRQEDERSSPRVRLLLDTRRSAYPDVDLGSMLGRHESAGFEWSLRMIGSLAASLAEDGFEVAIAETAEPQLSPPDPGSGASRSPGLLHSLAGARLREGGPDRPADAEDAPLIAVLADAVIARSWMAPPSGRGRWAAAFVLPEAAQAIPALRSAGWSCVAVDPESEPAEAWRMLLQEREVHRVG